MIEKSFQAIIRKVEYSGAKNGNQAFKICYVCRDNLRLVTYLRLTFADLSFAEASYAYRGTKKPQTRKVHKRCKL